MSKKQTLWIIAITAVLAVSVTAYRSSSRKCSATGECPASKEKEQQEKKSSSGSLIWEALSRQLLASANQ